MLSSSTPIKNIENIVLSSRTNEKEEEDCLIRDEFIGQATSAMFCLCHWRNMAPLATHALTLLRCCHRHGHFHGWRPRQCHSLACSLQFVNWLSLVCKEVEEAFGFAAVMLSHAANFSLDLKPARGVLGWNWWPTRGVLGQNQHNGWDASRSSCLVLCF